MGTEDLTPGSIRRITILKEILKAGLTAKALVPLLKLFDLEHVSGCLCESLCLDEECDCAEDAHLDPDCYYLRQGLRKATEDFYGYKEEEV